MRVLASIPEARGALRALRRPVGFVPTMGALHAGHLALASSARKRSASVVASIFVNPTQFGPGEDFERYPRDLDGDRAKLRDAGVDVLFVPEPGDMFPSNLSTYVDPGAVGASYEGAARPGHFRGVATVVVKLLHVVGPDAVYLGQKDAQQVAVLRKVLRDLDFHVDAVVEPTVREPDGLALSSRNAYLSPEERRAAPSLYRALQTFLNAMQGGTKKAGALKAARAVLDAHAVEDYIDLVDATTFEPVLLAAPGTVAIGAARFGTTRLIDNIAAER